MKVGNNVPNPIIRFGYGGLPDVMSEIHKAGFAAPTPIQSQEFALALTGQDMVGSRDCPDWVREDSWYLVPGIIHCNNQPYLERGDGPIVLVLVPTRYVGLI